METPAPAPVVVIVKCCVGGPLREKFADASDEMASTWTVKVWRVSGLPPVLSSPAVSGAVGDQVLLVGDTGGAFHAYDLNGNQVYSLATGGFVYSSPAVAGGLVYFTNASTGMLYALG